MASDVFIHKKNKHFVYIDFAWVKNSQMALKKRTI